MAEVEGTIEVGMIMQKGDVTMVEEAEVERAGGAIHTLDLQVPPPAKLNLQHL